jgi:hypothetical protein
MAVLSDFHDIYSNSLMMVIMTSDKMMGELWSPLLKNKIAYYIYILILYCVYDAEKCVN